MHVTMALGSEEGDGRVPQLCLFVFCLRAMIFKIKLTFAAFKQTKPYKNMISNLLGFVCPVLHIK